MGSLRTLQRFQPWVLVIFLFAQLAAVVPLLGTHLQHVLTGGHHLATSPVSSADAHQAHHLHSHTGAPHHGRAATEADDQCCAVHLLTGIMPSASPASRNKMLAASVAWSAFGPLLGTDRSPLDRPPKLPLSV
jgi:hypothetical protein